MEKSLFIVIAIGAVLAIALNASEKAAVLSNGTHSNFCECNNNICDGVENNTALPNEAGCEHFFICIDGRPIPSTCPPGQWFNYNISQCDNSTSPCDSGFDCPPDGIHFFPHDYYCDMFIMCFAGYPIQMTCAEGLHFDSELGQCNFPEYAECLLELCPRDSDNITFIPSDRFCDKFYICHAGNAIPFRCPDGLHFNPDLNTCDFIESANCTIDGPEPPPGPPQPHEIDCECAESIYFVAHPNSCEHYFICSFGQSFFMDCAPGFWFDTVNNWCDIPENVQCAANTTTSLAPTSTTTTTREYDGGDFPPPIVTPFPSFDKI